MVPWCDVKACVVVVSSCGTLHRAPPVGRPGFRFLVLAGACQFGTAWAGLCMADLILFIYFNYMFIYYFNGDVFIGWQHTAQASRGK